MSTNLRLGVLVASTLLLSCSAPKPILWETKLPVTQPEMPAVLGYVFLEPGALVLRGGASGADTLEDSVEVIEAEGLRSGGGTGTGDAGVNEKLNNQSDDMVQTVKASAATGLRGAAPGVADPVQDLFGVDEEEVVEVPKADCGADPERCTSEETSSVSQECDPEGIALELHQILSAPGVRSYVKDRRSHLGMDDDRKRSFRNTHDHMDDLKNKGADLSAESQLPDAVVLPDPEGPQPLSQTQSRAQLCQLLWTACKEGQYAAACRWLKLGADPKHANEADGGLTALHYAAESGDTRLIKHLIDSGIHPMVKDDSGNTPLHSASAEGHLAAAEALIQMGAQVQVSNKFGFNAADVAEAEKHLSLCKILEEYLQVWITRRQYIKAETAEENPFRNTEDAIAGKLSQLEQEEAIQEIKDKRKNQYRKRKLVRSSWVQTIEKHTSTVASRLIP